MTSEKTARCKICGKKGDLPCGGKGNMPVIREDERGVERTELVPCIGALIYQFRERVGEPIFRAAPIDSTPLLQPDQRDGDWDMTHKDLWLDANSETLRSHLRYVLWEKGQSFFFRILTDSLVLDSWLGREGTPYASLHEAVMDPELVILQLGVTSYANKALPGVLLEALHIRSYAGLPTWVVTSPSKPFNSAHLCYSTELERYLRQNHKVLPLSPSAAPASSSSKPSRPKDPPGKKSTVLGNLSRYS